MEGLSSAHGFRNRSGAGAIDVAALEDVARFEARVDGIVREVHANRRAPAVGRLCVPGEMEAEFEERHRSEGIPLDEKTLADIEDSAARLGVAAAGSAST